MRGWSDEALAHELLIVPRRAFHPWSGTEVIEGPGCLQIVTPSFRDGGLNEVMFATFEEGEVDARIDAAIARYRAHGLRFRWTITPDSRPADLDARLEARGLVRTELVGMIGSTDDVAGAEDPDIEVVRVDTPESSAEFVALMAAGWAIDPAPLAAYVGAQLDDPDERQGLFLARHRGRPAAAAGCVAFDRPSRVRAGGSLHLQGGVVLPEFRGRGLYRALTHARLRWAAERGIELVTVHALRSSSAPLLEHFGFRELLRFCSFAGR